MNTLRFTFRELLVIAIVVLEQILCCPYDGTISFVGNISWQTRILERYLEIEYVSLLRCAKECMVRKRCQSFNYDRYMNYCELCYVQEKNGTRDESNVGLEFVHSDIRHFDKNLIGNCKDHACDLRSKCHIKIGSCEISDCGQALRLPNTKILSYGHHEINNGVFYGCLPEFSMVDTTGNPTTDGLLRCNSNGQWAAPSFQCVYPCPDRWLQYGSGQYCIVTDGMTWAKAKESCISMNAHLVKLEDFSKKHWLVEKATGGKGKITVEDKGFWTGGNDLQTEDEFEWEVDHTNFKDLNWMWHALQPDNGGSSRGVQNCVRVVKFYSWWFDDMECDEKLAFICER